MNRTAVATKKRLFKWKYKFSVHPNHLYCWEWEIVHSQALAVSVHSAKFSTCLHHVGFLFPLFTFQQTLRLAELFMFSFSVYVLFLFFFVSVSRSFSCAERLGLFFCYFSWEIVRIVPSQWQNAFDDATAIIVHDDSDSSPIHRNENAQANINVYACRPFIEIGFNQLCGNDEASLRLPNHCTTYKPTFSRRVCFGSISVSRNEEW